MMTTEQVFGNQVLNIKSVNRMGLVKEVVGKVNEVIYSDSLKEMAVEVKSEKTEVHKKNRKVRTNRKAKKEKQVIPVYIPKNLDIEKFLEDNKPDFKYFIDNFKYIIGLVTEIPLYNKDILKDYDYIPFHGQTLQKRVHEYKDYINYLVLNGVLESDNHYIPDTKSTGYRFTKLYANELKRDSISKPSLIKWNKQQIESHLEDRIKYSYLYKWFTPELKIDFDSAADYLNEQLKANKRLGVKNTYLKHNCAGLAVEKISNCDFLFSVDKTVGRCHTNLTNINSKLRNFITYGGQKMVSVDIKNSQPCFSGLLLDPEFYIGAEGEAEKLGKKLSFKSFSNIKSKFFNKTIQNTLSSIMLVNQGANGGGKGIEKYLEIAQNGTLYEFLHDQILAATGKDIQERKKLKAAIFTVLFTDNRFWGQPKAEPKRLFEKIFPDVYKIFATIKSHDKTTLPKLLQAIEARVMLDHVAKRISVEMPDMPLFTIHDSIVCPVGYEDYVAAVISEEMMDKVGMRPTLKPEFWSPENVKDEIPMNQNNSPLLLAA